MEVTAYFQIQHIFTSMHGYLFFLGSDSNISRALHRILWKLEEGKVKLQKYVNVWGSCRTEAALLLAYRVTPERPLLLSGMDNIGIYLFFPLFGTDCFLSALFQMLRASI